MGSKDEEKNHVGRVQYHKLLLGQVFQRTYDFSVAPDFTQIISSVRLRPNSIDQIEWPHLENIFAMDCFSGLRLSHHQHQDEFHRVSFRPSKFGGSRLNPPPQVRSKYLRDFLAPFAAPAPDRALPRPPPRPPQATFFSEAPKFSNKPQEAKIVAVAPSGTFIGSSRPFGQAATVVPVTAGYQPPSGKSTRMESQQPLGMGDGSYQRGLEPDHHFPESISSSKRPNNFIGNLRDEAPGLTSVPGNWNDKKMSTIGPPFKKPVEPPRIAPVILNNFVPEQQSPIPKARRITKKRVDLQPLI